MYDPSTSNKKVNVTTNSTVCAKEKDGKTEKLNMNHVNTTTANMTDYAATYFGKYYIKTEFNRFYIKHVCLLYVIQFSDLIHFLNSKKLRFKYNTI